jgi:predicted deacetylase
MDWDKKKWFEIINNYEKTEQFVKIFKAPNWEMSRLGYQVLKELGWAVAVRKHQIVDVPQGMKYYCFETNLFGVHGHTWTMPAHNKEHMFLNWTENTNFDFVSNNLEVKI